MLGPRWFGPVRGDDHRRRVRDSATWYTVSIKGDLVGSDTPSSREALGLALARLVMVSFAEKELGIVASDDVLARFGELEPGAPELTSQFGAGRVRMERHLDGNYLLTVEPFPPT